MVNMNQDRYQLVATAIQWIYANRSHQPSLADVASAVGVSPYHFQRVFTDWAGVSPKLFLKSVTLQDAKQRLLRGSSVLETTFATGLSSPGRLHDLMITSEALTPGQVRKKGSDVSFSFGFSETPFGNALLTWNNRGLNFLGFCAHSNEQTVFQEWHQPWENATIQEMPEEAKKWASRVFAPGEQRDLRIHLRGSPFQLQVWSALLAIPPGSHASYSAVATAVSKPRASRAIGTAVGNNPIAWLIPCHRVLRKNGELGGYRWGEEIKSSMLAYEVCRSIKTDSSISSA